MPTDNTERKHSGLAPYKPGQSGNPNGRPKGARNKLGEAFLEDLAAAWEREGAQAIQRVIDTKPEVFVKVVADLMPKDMNLNVNKYEHMTDEQLLERQVPDRSGGPAPRQENGSLSPGPKFRPGSSETFSSGMFQSR